MFHLGGEVDCRGLGIVVTFPVLGRGEVREGNRWKKRRREFVLELFCVSITVTFFKCVAQTCRI